MSAGIATRQWIRKLQISIAGQTLTLDNMEASFQVRQADTPAPPYANIRILNLSDATMDSVFQKGAQVKIEGGYPGRFGVIFDGSAQQMRRGKLPNGVDKYLDVIAVSGSKAYNYSTVRESLDEGATARDIADKAIQSMQQYGVTIGSISERLAQRVHPRPVTLYGMSRDILRMVTESTNTSFFIHNGQINVVDNDGYLPGATIEINANSGMIGLPEQTLDGIVIKILLNPDCHPGQRVHVDASSIQAALVDQGWPGSEVPLLGQFEQRIPLPFGIRPGGKVPKIAQDGLYRIVRVDHDGSVEEQEWYTTITAIALGDPIANPARQQDPQDTGFRGIPEMQQDGQGQGGGQ
jgi:hypothetical protein